MFRAVAKTGLRLFSRSAPLRAAEVAPKVDLTPLKLDSNGCSDLYAIFKIHNIPYMVTKGDTVILPYRMKNQKIGDVLDLNNVTTIGSRNFTYTNEKGIPKQIYELRATLAEITREPKYQVFKKRQRCRRLKTVDVEPYQTHLVISELKLT